MTSPSRSDGWPRQTPSRPTPPPRPLSRGPSLPEQIVSRLKQQIATGELLPGAELPSEAALAAQFGVGRSTIREAKNALRLIGLIEVRAGLGSRVVFDAAGVLQLSRVFDRGGPQGAAILDLYEVRRLLESGAAALAARRATAADLRGLSRSVALLRSLAENGASEEAILSADTAFHQAVVEATHNPILARLYAGLVEPIGEAVSRMVRVPHNAQLAARANQRIHQAIADRRPALAERLTLEHLEVMERTIRAELA